MCTRRFTPTKEANLSKVLFPLLFTSLCESLVGMPRLVWHSSVKRLVKTAFFLWVIGTFSQQCFYCRSFTISFCFQDILKEIPARYPASLNCGQHFSVWQRAMASRFVWVRARTCVRVRPCACVMLSPCFWSTRLRDFTRTLLLG